MAEWVLIAVELLNLVGTSALTIFCAYIGKQQRELHAEKSQSKAQAIEIVKLELATHTSPLKQSIDGLTREIASIHTRLERGDENLDDDFKEINKHRESMSIQLERRFGDLQKFMLETFASKNDLKDHENSVALKFERMKDDSFELGRQLAMLNERTEK